MSASQDKSQKPKFISSNVLPLFKDGRTHQVSNPNVESVSTTSHSKKVKTTVIKAADLKKDEKPSHQIQEFIPTEIVGKKVVARPDLISGLATPALAVQSLKHNLKSLNDLQSRLRFLLKEIEELTQE